MAVSYICSTSKAVLNDLFRHISADKYSINVNDVIIRSWCLRRENKSMVARGLFYYIHGNSEELSPKRTVMKMTLKMWNPGEVFTAMRTKVSEWTVFLSCF